MSEAFDLTCRKCKAELHIVLKGEPSLKPFTCPGCGTSLVVDAQMASTPIAQLDPSSSPAAGAKVTHMFGPVFPRAAAQPDEECGVCGNSFGLTDHDQCEEAEQVEPYDPN
jgi:hypothetical protein